ncbi:MAG TPA: class I SAM-dependent RNA methyltransferase [Aggregatilineales bacterium]|nr:class I SAM-dependent RNA methyltransferase [Anaerolineales bacterium]HRE46165.1 class I SAM-dependent RNA methyltransferase [Aggregatilineales bacterium]
MSDTTHSDSTQTDDFELTLTGMAHGGSAVGRHEGRAIFVPYAISGEVITARITEDKGRFAFAEGITLLDPADSRIYPECPHFGPKRCGGCQWQHIDYPAQLDFKRQIVIDQLARIGGIADPLVHPVLASPDVWAYRSHMTMQITPEGRLGFVSTDGQTVIGIDECHLMRPELLALFESFEVDLETNPNLDRVRFQVGSAPDDLLIALTTTDDEEPFIALELPATVAFLDGDEIAHPLIGLGHVHYTIHDKHFRVTAGSFFQVNLPQAGRLVDLVLAALDLKGTERVLDLYSGVGLFTAFLAERARLVTAIETFPAAVNDADHNLSAYENVTLIEGAVEDVLAESTERYECAVVDPPRAGMEGEALDALVARQPKVIAYVSCDMATLARDAKRLKGKGYRLAEVQPVDMFPQTYHIEAVAVFRRE